MAKYCWTDGNKYSLKIPTLKTLNGLSWLRMEYSGRFL